MKIISKGILIGCLFLIMLAAFAIASNAAYYPDGNTEYIYDYPSGDCNRTINIVCKDTNGKTLKEVVVYTKTGGNDYDAVGFILYGYNIIEFSSDAGLFTKLEMSWTTGGDPFGCYIGIGYHFTALLSQNTVNVDIVCEIDKNIKVNVNHYTVDASGISTPRSSTTYTYTYGDKMNIKAMTFNEYELRSGYLSEFTGNFSYDLVGASKNIGRIPNGFKYNLVDSKWQGQMKNFSKWSKAKDGNIGECVNKVMTINFYYDLKTYTVTYNANGGTGAPSAQTKTYGVDLKLSTTKPTRAGYTFLGWSNSSTTGTVKYQPGESYKEDNAIILYAVWQSNAPAIYTITYNANGGSAAPAAQNKTHDVALTLSSIRPTRTGYTFLGWSTSSTATGATYQPGGSYTANASVTLYAVWQTNAPATYTVTYNANGGSGAPASQIKTENVTLVLSSVIPTRSGYYFLGWSTSSAATGATYQPGGSYTANASVTLYAVWQTNAPATYTVTYNANGGSGAPASQIKTENVTLVLSSVIPTRSGYYFLGWSSSGTATVATYYPGGSYTANASITLYAVWRQNNYDLSVTSITLPAGEAETGSTIQVTARIDSWDMYSDYYNIPVELLYNNVIIETRYISIPAYGIVNLDFLLDVGSDVRESTVTVRVNWYDRLNETDPSNNSKQALMKVISPSPVYELRPDGVVPNGSYREGTEVISSFRVYNDGSSAILPSNNKTVKFEAYYYNGAAKTVLNSQTWNAFVCPANAENLIYFKWFVPDGLAGETVYCSITINSDSGDNTAFFTTDVIGKLSSQPSDTVYGTKPSDYNGTSAPAEYSQTQLSWSVWEYEGGDFILKTYRAEVSADKPVLTPDINAASAYRSGGRWYIKSGYGVSINYSPTVISNAPTSAYTGVQTVYALFPEFDYSGAYGYYATLENLGGIWQFVKNNASSSNARIHFIPVWYPNGAYIVSVTATDVWTPAGMISAVVNTADLIVDGVIYDDWYFG